METVEIRTPGLITREHVIEVPLVPGAPSDARTIEVFAREVCDPDGTERPFLVFFQGGPGFEATRPTGVPVGPGFVARALREFRVLLLDQRGTGRSTPVSDTALADLSPDEQAEHLTHFRADAIVADAEALREALGVERWSVLGQSFGGFCVCAYLSRAGDSLRAALFTGGLPPLGPDRIDDVYRRTYANVVDRCRRHYARWPGDRERALALRERCDAGAQLLPDGSPLTWRRFRQVGNRLGDTDGSQRLHQLLELPFESLAFAHDADDPLSFQRNPLYAVVHEACYADGGTTRWSAQRMLPDVYDAEPELLTGEHVFPWMFEDYRGLGPLREAAERLAEHEWPRLYDPAALAASEVPAAAAIYGDDMYVDRALSEETAAAIGSLRPWLTNEYEHGGLRDDGERVLGRLLDLVHGRA